MTPSKSSCLSDGCVSSSNNKMPMKQRNFDETESEIDFSDRGLNSLEEIPRIFYCNNITRLTLSHNKIRTIPQSIANLSNLEMLNLFNNQLEDIPTSLATMPKLKILNVGMNKLSFLPRGFGSCPSLEVLDLTYNNLNNNSLPANFFMLTTLRALYFGDNDFELLSPEVGNLKNLQILVLRDNDLLMLPAEIGLLTKLKELHIQGNRLTILPPEIGALDLTSQRSIVRMENNPWVHPIAEQLALGSHHVIEYIRSDAYRFLYGRHNQSFNPSAVPNKNDEKKAKKLSRARK